MAKDKVDEKPKVSPSAASSSFTEDVFSAKLDMCLTDTIVKAGAGFGLGALSSLLFFRRRWPIIAGMGIGIGIAWANCEHELNSQVERKGSL